jgi:hypothetical protein
VQLTARLVALLVVTAAAGFGAAFMVARSGAEESAATAPARKTLPPVATTGVDQTVRGVGAAAALPDLHRRPRTPTTTTTRPPPTTTEPPPTTTHPPPTTQPPTTTQSRPPPTTTQSAPPVTTQSG